MKNSCEKSSSYDGIIRIRFKGPGHPVSAIPPCSPQLSAKCLRRKGLSRPCDIRFSIGCKYYIPKKSVVKRFFNMDQCFFRGIRIDVGGAEEALEMATAALREGGVICTPNPAILHEASVNAELAYALNASSLAFPDGCGLALALRIRGIKCGVLPGVELGETLVKLAASEGTPVMIVGGKKGTARRAALRLSEKYGAVIPYFTDGYHQYEEELLTKLSKCGRALVLICTGCPRQEIACRILHEKSPGSCFCALGGSVDVYAGDKKRAPAPFRRLHLEWLFRMISEPRRAGAAIKSITGVFTIITDKTLKICTKNNN